MLQAGDYRRKHQAEAGGHCPKQEVDTLKMCLDEEELNIAIFAILIPTGGINHIVYPCNAPATLREAMR